MPTAIDDDPKTFQVTGYRCQQCGHEWVPRPFRTQEDGLPRLCPKCKSVRWDRQGGQWDHRHQRVVAPKRSSKLK